MNNERVHGARGHDTEGEVVGAPERRAHMFSAAPGAMWDQDFSRVEDWLNELRADGVVDLRRYLADRPEDLDLAIGLIRVVDVNQSAVDLLEADSEEQLLAGYPLELLTESIRSAFVEWLVAVWERRASVELEFTGVTLSGRRIDGLLRWHAAVVEGVIDYSRVVTIVTDKTARELALEALRESEERFRVLFDTAADAFIGMDQEHRIALFNEEAVSLFGYQVDEIIGQPLVTLLPARFRQRHPSHVESFAQDPTVRRRMMNARGPMWGLRKNGQEFPVEVTIAKRPVDGHFEFTAVVRDTTEREQAQQAIEASLRSKDELIASISHELRTPLAAVVGFAQILQHEESGLSAEERAEVIGLIADEGLDLAGIVDDLLVAAKVKSGTLNAVRVPVDLWAQAAQVLENRSQQESEHIELIKSSVRAMADPARVRQILRNLISNALKYGGDRIRIKMSSDDTTVRLRVCDNGPGIPEDERQHIFEPYRRADQDPGLTLSLGLGLTISRQLAQLMDGDLTYRHDETESIFELSLPIAT